MVATPPTNTGVLDTTSTTVVVTQVLANRPVPVLTTTPTTTTNINVVDTTELNLGCKSLSQAKAGQAEVHQKSPTNTEDEELLKSTNTPVRRQPTINKVGEGDQQQPGTPLDTTLVDNTRGNVNKCFDTADTTSPSSDQFQSSDDADNTSSGHLAAGTTRMNLNFERSVTKGDLKSEQREDGSEVVRDAKLKLGDQDTTQNSTCVHMRGGWCSVHLKFAKKTARITKTWDKLSSGLFGWRMRRKTVYSCGTEPIPIASSDQPGPSVLFNTKGRGLVRKRGSTSGNYGVD